MDLMLAILKGNAKRKTKNKNLYLFNSLHADKALYHKAVFAFIGGVGGDGIFQTQWAILLVHGGCRMLRS